MKLSLEGQKQEQPRSINFDDEWKIKLEENVKGRERERDLLKPFEIYFIGALSTQCQFKTSETSVNDSDIGTTRDRYK